MRRLLSVVLALLVLQTASACSEARRGEDRAGDVYEVRLESVTQTSGDDGSSGSSSSATTLVERVIALRDGGVELEFDLPEQTSAEERARSWQFPVRVFWSPERQLRLLNSPELEVRLQSWLQRAGLTEAACGRWILTWTAIKIECDPEAVLEIVEPYNLRLGDIRDGASYGEDGALGSAPLRIQSRSADGQVFTTELEIDPDKVRRQRAEADVALAQMMGQAPLALEAALQAWSGRQVSGTMTTTIETDSTGRVTKQTTVASLALTNERGSQERHTSTVTVERRLVSEKRP